MTLPVLASAVVALVVALPAIPPATSASRARRLAVGVAAAGACWVPGLPAAALLAAATALHAPGSAARAGSGMLLLAAAAHAAAGVAAALGRPEAALAASLLALALRSGAPPLHAGTAALAARAPGVLVELGGTSLAAVVVHLRDVIPAAPGTAAAAADGVVFAGALAALISGLGSLSRTSLRGLWSSSVSVHGGMLLAAVGAAGRGHVAGAVFVAVAFALALGGFGAMLEALEARTGRIDLRLPGGRSQRFPRASWSLAFFAAAGVALPGTVGFAADDLLLHALWSESPVACGLTLAASALLAVGLLRGWSAAALGPAGRDWTAEDLGPREGAVVALLAAVLVGFGVAPMGLLGPTLAAFGAP